MTERKINSMVKAVAYTRVSTMIQALNNNSLYTQKQALQEYADQNNYVIEKIFTDEGCSGQNINRPGYQGLTEYIENNDVDIILVYKFDRLHRNYENMLEDYEYFKSRNIMFFSVSENMYSTDDEDTFFQIALKAEEFSEKLSHCTYEKQKEKAMDSKFLGGAVPYGIIIDDGNYTIDEKTAPVVLKIFEMFNAGTSYENIIKWLKQHNCKTNSGKEFTVNSIKSILKNEKYTGNYIWGRTNGKNKEGHRNSSIINDDYIKISGGCPQIVSNELFNSVQQKLSGKHNIRTNSKHYYMLNGKVKCKCGALMSGIVHNTNKNSKYYLYKCTAKCGMHTVNADYLDEAVAFTLKKCLFNESNLQLIYEKFGNEFSEIQSLENSFVEYITKNNNAECRCFIYGFIKDVTILSDKIEINFHNGVTIDKATRKFFRNSH